MRENTKSTEKDRFYIGYLKEAPKAIKKKLMLYVCVIASLIVVIPIVIVLNQNKPNNHEVDEKTSTMLGFWVSQPLPMLIVPTDTLKRQFNTIVVVAQGKFGALPIVQQWEGEHVEKLHGKWVQLKGNLIHGDGQTVMQIETPNDIVRINAKPSDLELTDYLIKEDETQSQILTGEILDPKCFFGVMKPGDGKIHRSCAIRCISGGIPPIFRVRTEQGFRYFLLRGVQGEDIGEAILPVVAEMIKVNGKVQQMGNWPILKINPNDIVRLYYSTINIAWCFPQKNIVPPLSPSPTLK